MGLFSNEVSVVLYEFYQILFLMSTSFGVYRGSMCWSLIVYTKFQEFMDLSYH